jgi:hypothetical protein
MEDQHDAGSAMTGTPKKNCFVVGPIGAADSTERIHADWVLEEIINPVMAEFPFAVHRSDKLITQV